MHSVLLIYTPNFFQYYIHTFSQILILGFTTPTQVASATHWLIEYCSSYWCFPGGSAGKEFTSNAGDPGSIPGSGKSPGEGNGYPLQYSCLKKSMDRGAWWATLHTVAKSQHDRVTNTFRTQCYHSTFPASLPRAMVWERIRVSRAPSCTSQFGMESGEPPTSIV